MRIWGLVTFIAALALGQGAHAAVLAGTLTTDNSGQILFGVDYTVPADGLTYRWDLWTDASHSNALISLGAPNEVFSVGQISNGDGTTHSVFPGPGPSYMWNPTSTPGHLSILVEAAPSFNNCSAATPAGVLCGQSNNVWGNAVPLSVNVKDAVNIYFTATAIPEPAAWLLMLTGVAGIGGALRLRRQMLRRTDAAAA